MIPKVLCDAFSVLGAGQMEAALTACLRTADGSSPSPTDKAALKRAEQPPSAVGPGPLRPAPLLQPGCRAWAPLPHTLHSQLADKSCLLQWAFVLEPARRAAVAFFVSRGSQCGPLPAPSSPLCSGPHLLVSLLDCALDGIKGEARNSPHWASPFPKVVGKELWERKGGSHEARKERSIRGRSPSS